MNGWMCDLGDDLSHKRALGSPCGFCAAPANRGCRGSDGKPLPGNLIHLARRPKAPTETQLSGYTAQEGLDHD